MTNTSGGSSRLRLLPLGGLGEIGMNCLALEHAGDVVVIDCGTRFPTDDLGVDVIHPDFGWLERQRERFRAVVLTHGHEDHIGALPYLLRRVNVPVYGPLHALRLVAQRLAQHGFDEAEVVLREVRPSVRFAVGSFEFEPIRVSHSIVQATALGIRTSAGTVLHTGDFKFDPAPSDGETTDEVRLAELAQEGVDLLLSDSTNVDELGEAGSEGAVGQHLAERVESAPGRAVVVLFASNVQRLISLGRIAQQTSRRILPLGTSLVRHIELAREIGVLSWPKELVLAPERARSFPRRELLVLASGTQAEPGSAAWRLSQQSHRFLDLDPGDRVIFSSRIIPGRERQVVAMICDLLRLELEVEWGKRSGAHSSGHACRDEQGRMIRLVRPRAFVPVHGTLHHLLQHARLARELGVSEVDVVENGQSLVLERGRLHRGERIEVSDVCVGQGGQLLDAEALERRRALGRNGQLTVVAACDRRGKLLSPPLARAVSVPALERDPREVSELSEALQDAWGTLRRRAVPELELEVQKWVEKWLWVRHRVGPVVTVVIASEDLGRR